MRRRGPLTATTSAIVARRYGPWRLPLVSACPVDGYVAFDGERRRSLRKQFPRRPGAFASTFLLTVSSNTQEEEKCHWPRERGRMGIGARWVVKSAASR